MCVKRVTALLLLLLRYYFALLANSSGTLAMPHNHDEIIIVEDTLDLGVNLNMNETNSTSAFITLSEANDELESVPLFVVGTEDALVEQQTLPVDDLNFLVKKTQPEEQQSVELLATHYNEDSPTSHMHNNMDMASNEEHETKHEIDLIQTKPIDMSDFLNLIPIAKVKKITDNYYRNDPEVQRAYAFLSSTYFAEMRQHIMQMPEMKAFFHYLTNNGLNVHSFADTLENLTTITADINLDKAELAEQSNQVTSVVNLSNEIEKRITDATLLVITTTDTPLDTTTVEQLNGLHGLVDSILDVLPQDQILATFFDKLENNEQFSKLVDSIGTATFGHILSNLQNSVPLRNLIFTLHNNGIYVTRIVDSLKSYFFLGTL